MFKGSHAGEVMSDIVGKKFGSLTVLSDHISVPVNGGTNIKFRCRCDCGNEDFYFRDALLKRKVDYCAKCRPTGRRHKKLYHVYHGMKQRCYNKSNPNYKNYGEKGVRLCHEWLMSYHEFERWALDHGYTEGLTIDRIDSNGDYCPENCRWVSLSENSAGGNYGKHKNTTKLEYAYAITPDGKTEEIQNLTKFADKHGLKLSSVSAILHGRMPPVYQGYTFYSNLSRKV